MGGASTNVWPQLKHISDIRHYCSGNDAGSNEILIFDVSLQKRNSGARFLPIRNVLFINTFAGFKTYHIFATL